MSIGQPPVRRPAAPPIRVLFLCTGNSCRSIFAEGLLRTLGGPDFDVHSAGTDPRGLNALSLRVLDEAGIEHAWARSKSVQEYIGQGFDYVVTVCDDAREACPVFPGSHEPLHWGYEDPAAASGTEDERLVVYRRVFSLMADRIREFVPVAQARRQRLAVTADGWARTSPG